MAPRLTATIGVLATLAIAGCGKDDESGATAQRVATATTPAATTSTGAAKTSKAGSSKASSKRSATRTTDARTDAATGAAKKRAGSSGSGSASAGTAKKAGRKQVTTSTTPLPAVTPKGPGADLTSGTGSGPGPARLDVVAVLKRYYTAFLERDGATVCSLLTSSGREIMVRDGNAKTCAASVERIVDHASADNLALLERTRAGLHIDDITVRGNNATAQIGKTTTLRLVRQDGDWLVRSPNVEVSRS